MRTTLFSFLLLAAASLANFSCGDSGDDTVFADAPANPDQAKLLQLVNDARTAGRNCGGASKPAVTAVTWNDTLEVVAKKHSDFMASNDKLTHTGASGAGVEERILAEGYVPSFYIENLLHGGATEEEALQAWLESADHCENIMDAGVLEMGVGTKGSYWTLVMAAH